MKQNNKMIKRKWKLGFVQASFLLAFLLIITSWIYIFKVENAALFSLFSQENLQFTQRFLADLIGIGEEVKAYTNKDSWIQAIMLSFETLIMSVIAIGFATIATMLTFIPAARTAADGTLTLTKKWYGKILYFIIRAIFIFTRAVPELIWAMIIIFIFKPGILPGAIALALHNFGILGKLCAEVVEDMDLRPIRSLASSGAGKVEIFVYGIVPTIMPRFITYMLYRWEVIIRTTIVVGFVGAGGLGQQFKLSMSWFHYTEITLFLLCYIILVFIVDGISEAIRKAIQ